MPKKILIADDSLFMRRILKDILSAKEKYEIVEAQNGKEAEQQFKKHNPDLTLLDIIMPEGEEEGITVLKAIKKLSSGAKVVMITAVGQDSIIAECKKAGASDYIIKPFDKEKIIKTVEKYLS
ncbi:MAG: response regulator [Candidatus Omnitrophica bacterium]|nr:response regulator [Candidatus Omnitrophota bacterium]MBU1524682.1 response regulator [Candidatus Omnitrophota bacterium]